MSRDARITQIYEGTNGIQALDLVGRKMPEDYGRLMRHFFHPVADFLAAEKDNAAIAEMLPYFMSAFGKLQISTITVATRGFGNPDEAGAAASDYLKLFALCRGRLHVAENGESCGGKIAGGGRPRRVLRRQAENRAFLFREDPAAGKFALNLSILAGSANPLWIFRPKRFKPICETRAIYPAPFFKKLWPSTSKESRTRGNDVPRCAGDWTHTNRMRGIYLAVAAWQRGDLETAEDYIRKAIGYLRIWQPPIIAISAAC